ncbi:MAG: hypothetical protein ACRDD7_01720 [Peptostreptococcaceae bacterium]
MKFKIIIDDKITIDKEIEGKFKSFEIYTDLNSYSFETSVKQNPTKRRNGVGVKAEMERYSKPVNDKKKSKAPTNMSGEEVAELFSDLFVEEKPKPILIDEDEIDKITEILEKKFKNQ